MKLSLLTTITAYAFAAASPLAAAADDMAALAKRDDCGAGSAPYTRRTNSPCGAGNGGHTYCGCDQTGVVLCQGGFWREIIDCQQGGSSDQYCRGTGSGANCVG